MFAGSYFGAHYFAARYFAKVGGGPVETIERIRIVFSARIPSIIIVPIE
jgi:hypothetical protein